MRKSAIVNAVLLAVVLSGLSSCADKPHGDHHDPGAVKVDSNLAHLLKPSNEQVVSKLPVLKAGYGSRIFTEELQGLITYDARSEHNLSSRIGGRIEQLYVRFNYQRVKKGQLIMEIYSPELAAAQQELLYLSQTAEDAALLNQARQKLQLLGMTSQGINAVLKRGKPDYRVPVYSPIDGYILEKNVSAPSAAAAPQVESEAGGMDNMGGGASSPAAAQAADQPVVNSPVMLRTGQYVNAGQSLFTIYDASKMVAEFSLKPELAAHIHKGDKLVLYRTTDKSGSELAAIGLIQPVFKSALRFTVARVYLPAGNFKAGELVTAKVPVAVPASWWLPESAVAAIGNSKIVFKKEGNVFVPKLVKSGLGYEGVVQIKQDISNWEISSNAAYLVDSESFIKMKENLQQ